MNREQFERFINAMMMGSDEKETIQKIKTDEEMFPNGDTDDYEEDRMEDIYHELGE